MLRPSGLVLLLGLAGAAWAEPSIDRAVVTVEKRSARDWCALDAQVSDLVPVAADKLAAVIQDYASYPRLFPRIHDASAEAVSGAVLLSETVVVEALGIRNVNRFTLRLTADAGPASFRLSWTQESTDGSIDSLEGSWTLEDHGTADRPLTRITYTTKSAVPVVAFGQDLLLRLFLGGETRGVVEAVVKAARSQ